MGGGRGTGFYITPDARLKASVYLDTERFADPGLEANYTAGKCDSISKDRNLTLTQSSDVHGGVKAQQSVGALTYDGFHYAPTTAVKKWYRTSAWVKRGATGSSNVRLTLFGDTVVRPSYIHTITDAVSTQYIATGYQSYSYNEIDGPYIY